MYLKLKIIQKNPHQVVFTAVEPGLLKFKKEGSPVTVSVQGLSRHLNLFAKGQLAKVGVAAGAGCHAEQHWGKSAGISEQLLL